VLCLFNQNGLYLFDNGVRFDMTYEPRRDIQTNPAAGARILRDPRGALARERGSRTRTGHPIHPSYLEPGDAAYVRWFLWMFRQFLRLGQASGARVTDAHLASSSTPRLHCSSCVARCTRCAAGPSAAWTISAWRSEMAPELVQTYGSLNPREVLAATRRLPAIYERVCPAYCHKPGIEYAAYEVAMLSRALTEFDAIDQFARCRGVARRTLDLHLGLWS
jgi:hypothetical protein